MKPMSVIFLLILLIIFGQYGTDNKGLILVDSELNDSRREYESKTKRTLNCIQQALRVESDSDSLKVENDLADLYGRLSRISIVKDSLVKIISPQLSGNDLVDLLEKFKVTVIDLHKPRYPTVNIEFYFEQDLNFIRTNIQPVPREVYSELFKHIIERWTNQSYISFLQSWAIDYPCKT